MAETTKSANTFENEQFLILFSISSITKILNKTLLMSVFSYILKILISLYFF